MEIKNLLNQNLHVNFGVFRMFRTINCLLY